MFQKKPAAQVGLAFPCSTLTCQTRGRVVHSNDIGSDRAPLICAVHCRAVPTLLSLSTKDGQLL